MSAVFDYDVEFGDEVPGELDWEQELANEPEELDDDEDRPAEQWVIDALGFNPDEEDWGGDAGEALPG